MAGKKGKKKVPIRTELTSLAETGHFEQERKSVLNAVQLIRALFDRKANTHEELTEWLDEADEWMMKLDEWELNEELMSKCTDLKEVIKETFYALHDRYEELDQKRQEWEDRCSFNLVHLYPTNGIELTSDQYCKMFDSNIDDFDEWADISEKKITVAVDQFKEETNAYYQGRECERKQLRQWKLDLKKNMHVELDDLKKLVEKVYDQTKVQDIRSKLMRDLFIDQLPLFLRQEVLQCDTIEECTEALKPIFEKFQHKHTQRDNERKLVDQSADLYLIFLRQLFSPCDSEPEQKPASKDMTPNTNNQANVKAKPNSVTTKSSTSALKGNPWWVLPSSSPADKSKGIKSTNEKKSAKPADIDEATWTEVNSSMETIKSILRERPTNYTQLTSWCNTADSWMVKLEKLMDNSEIMACRELESKLTSLNDLLSRHHKVMLDMESAWQDLVLHLFHYELPEEMGINLSEDEYNDLLFNAKFSDNNFEIDYSIVRHI